MAGLVVGSAAGAQQFVRNRPDPVATRAPRSTTSSMGSGEASSRGFSDSPSMRSITR